MSGRAMFKQIQGSVNRTNGPRDYHYYENLIFDDAKVKATVKVQDGFISIRTETYADFILAKSAIQGQVSVEIIRE